MAINPSSTDKGPLVGIIMGSSSDWETLQHAAKTLAELGVPHEARVVSAHRTPDLLFEYASSAEQRGIEVIIAGAGRAGGVESVEGLGFSAIDRADARRHSRGNGGDRQSRGD